MPCTASHWLALSDGDWLRLGRELSVPPGRMAVMRLILVEDAPIALIAERLVISQNSVRSHIERLYKKNLKVRSRNEMNTRVTTEWLKIRDERMGSGAG